MYLYCSALVVAFSNKWYSSLLVSFTNSVFKIANLLNNSIGCSTWLPPTEGDKAYWLSITIFEIVEPKYKFVEDGPNSNLKEYRLGVTLSSSLHEKRKEGGNVTPFDNMPFLITVVHLEFKIEIGLVGLLTLIP